MKKFLLSIIIIMCGIPCYILYGLMYVCCAPLALYGWITKGHYDVYPWVDKFASGIKIR